MEEFKDLVVKSNHLMEARYKLNLIEQKIMLQLISKIEQHDKEFHIYTFDIKDLALSIDLNPDLKNAYRDIQQATRTLVGRVLQLYSEKENSLLQVSWLSSAKYHYNDGTVELKISEDLKPYLLQLKNRFKAYPLKYVIQFKKSYSFRFYDLLKQYENIGQRTFKVTELRRILLIEDKEYSRFYDFERWVIKPSVKEINEKSDLKITYEKQKKGRNVESIHFTIQQKTGADQFEAELEERQRELLRRGLFQKIEKNYLLGNLKEFSTEKVETAIRVVEASKNKENPTGLFLEAMKNNWKVN